MLFSKPEEFELIESIAEAGKFDIYEIFKEAQKREINLIEIIEYKKDGLDLLKLIFENNINFYIDRRFSKPESKKDFLKAMLKIAEETEDFEKAASIRDKLKINAFDEFLKQNPELTENDKIYLVSAEDGIIQTTLKRALDLKDVINNQEIFIFSNKLDAVDKYKNI